MLRGFTRNWLKVLVDAFLATQPGQRAGISSAISAYAAISDPAVLTPFLRDALGKYIQVRIIEEEVSPVEQSSVRLAALTVHKDMSMICAH